MKKIDDCFKDNNDAAGYPVSPTNILLVRQIKVSGWEGHNPTMLFTLDSLLHYIVLHCWSPIPSFLYFALYLCMRVILYFVFDFCICVHLSSVGRWPFVWLQTCFLSPCLLIGDRIKSRANSFVSHSLSFRRESSSS